MSSSASLSTSPVTAHSASLSERIRSLSLVPPARAMTCSIVQLSSSTRLSKTVLTGSDRRDDGQAGRVNERDVSQNLLEVLFSGWCGEVNAACVGDLRCRLEKLVVCCVKLGSVHGSRPRFLPVVDSWFGRVVGNQWFWWIVWHQRFWWIDWDKWFDGLERFGVRLDRFGRFWKWVGNEGVRY